MIKKVFVFCGLILVFCIMLVISIAVILAIIEVILDFVYKCKSRKISIMNSFEEVKKR